MKRLLPLLALALLFGGCGISTLGLPTVTVNLQSSTVTAASTTSSTGVVTTTYTRTAVLEFRTLPGSPAGKVTSFTDQSGNTFPGGAYLNDCPTSSTTDCGPVDFTVSYQFLDPTQEPKVILLTYQLSGNNGTTKQITIEGNGIAIN